MFLLNFDRCPSFPFPYSTLNSKRKPIERSMNYHFRADHKIFVRFFSTFRLCFTTFKRRELTNVHDKQSILLVCKKTGCWRTYNITINLDFLSFHSYNINEPGLIIHIKWYQAYIYCVGTNPIILLLISVYGITDHWLYGSASEVLK